MTQTRARIVRGVTNSKAKLISIFEPHAQILRRGKLHRPTEFGQMVKVQEAEGGIVTDIGVVAEKSDAPLLVPAVERHIEVFGHAPQVTATDRDQVVRDSGPERRSFGSALASVTTARHAEPMFEARDASLAPSAPCPASTEPALSFVSNALLGLMTWLGDDRMLDAEFAVVSTTCAKASCTLRRRVIAHAT